MRLVVQTLYSPIEGRIVALVQKKSCYIVCLAGTGPDLQPTAQAGSCGKRLVGACSRSGAVRRTVQIPAARNWTASRCSGCRNHRSSRRSVDIVVEWCRRVVNIVAPWLLIGEKKKMKGAMILLTSTAMCSINEYRECCGLGICYTEFCNWEMLKQYERVFPSVHATAII